MTRCIQKEESRHVHTILLSVQLCMVEGLPYDNQGMRFCAVRPVCLRLHAIMFAMKVRLISIYVDAVLADSVLPEHFGRHAACHALSQTYMQSMH